MRIRLHLPIIALALFLSPIAFVQSRSAENVNEQFIPRLADIMSTIQLRHIKLWFAAKSSNWPLAEYELLRFKANLVDAASLYTGIPVTNVTTMAEPVQAVADAIKAKNSRAFEQAFGSMTIGCNTCHQSMDRGYIVMRIPTASPFSDQVFPLQGNNR